MLGTQPQMDKSDLIHLSKNLSAGQVCKAGVVVISSPALFLCTLGHRKLREMTALYENFRGSNKQEPLTNKTD